MGFRGGLVLGNGSGFRELTSGIVGRGICRESLLARARGLSELDLGCNFQPRGSWPMINDVLTGGGEEQDEVVEEVEEDEE